MLSKVGAGVSNYLECGCNIGRNVDQLKIAPPEATPSVIEISEPALRSLIARHRFDHAFNGAIPD